MGERQKTQPSLSMAHKSLDHNCVFMQLYLVRWLRCSGPWVLLQLHLPVAPPTVLYGNRVGEGHLGIKFMRVKARPWDTASKCVQVM